MKHDLYEFNPDDAWRFAREAGIECRVKGTELHFKYCPYCRGGENRDTNTFAISLEPDKKGAFNCKRGSCRVKGNMITLMKDFDFFSLGDGIDDYYLQRERYIKFVRRKIETKCQAVKYMQSRGIPEEITRKYEITVHKKKPNVIVFPFVDDKNDLWYIKYRDIAYTKDSAGSKEWCEPNRKPILFGMNHCNFENHTLVMTEGQIDSLSCTAAGIENAVSVPLGKNGFTWIPYCFNFLGRFDELIIFGDYENGEISLLDGMKNHFHGTVKHVRPEDYLDCKDANEILIKYGADQIRKCIKNAVELPVEGLKKMAEIQKIRLGDLDRMDTGIAKLDQLCPFYFGELIVLTGAAGDGKSTMASQWATMAIDQGYPTMMYSGEMPTWLVKNWMDLQIVGRHNLNDYNDIEEGTYKRMVEWSMYQKLYVYDVEEEENGQDKLLDVLMKGIQKYGIRFIVLDNLMTAMDYNDNLELNEAQTVFTKKLANIAQNHNVLIVLIVHPRKSKTGYFSNEDIAGSSNITNRAHKTIRYSRPQTKDGLAPEWDRELTVLKDRLTGHIITDGIPLYFQEKTKRISDKPDAFGWKLGWETDEDGFADADDDEIPF